jgi:ABC-type siderophore export system fused ATPase/permease subunit|tara:strand:- start:318 stop:599 length:282 start_codon:yes stop_codon:yes gene_type:complete
MPMKMDEMVDMDKENAKGIDWYIKWTASMLLIAAIVIRSSGLSPTYDIMLSTIGVILWLIVSIIWKDRAMIILNSVCSFFLVLGLIRVIGELV